MNCVIFDLETTGFQGPREEIIQIAAVRMIDGQVMPTDSFTTYVNPGASLSSFITAYTGITDADVRHAPRPPEALREFSKFVGDSVLIAHNGHRFDIPVLRGSCLLHRLPTREIAYFDSLHLSWKVWGRRGQRHGMDHVISRLQLDTATHRRHDARGDVALLGMAVERMWRSVSTDFSQPPVKSYLGVLAEPPS